MTQPIPSEQEHGDTLNDLLRGEIAAAETYVQALARFHGRPEARALERLRDDHVEAANQLQRFVQLHDVKPATSSGPWGAFAKAVEGTAKVLGDTPALKALRAGEEYGTHLYERVLGEHALDPAARTVIASSLLPRQTAHVRTLTGLARAT